MTTFREKFARIKTFPRAFWLLISAVFINQAGNAAIVFLVLYLTQHLHFSLIEASYVFGALGISMLLAGLLGGALIDRFGGARMMAAALFCNSLVLLTFPLVKNFHNIFCLCIAWGLIFGFYRPATQTFVAVLTPTNTHKIAFSVYRLAVNLGMSIGPAVAGYLAMHSYPAIFIANGISNLLAGIILFFGFRQTQYWLIQKSASKTQKPSGFGFKWIFRDKLLYWFLIGLIPISMVFYQHSSTLPVFLKQNLQLGPEFYGLLFTFNTLMIVFFELPLNVATLNWPHRISLLGGSLFLTIGFAGFLFATQTWHAIALTVIWTLGEMILYPTTTTYISELAPEERRGSYMALYSSCITMGSSFGPWLGGLVMSHYTAHGLWFVCAAAGVISLLVYGSMPILKPILDRPNL